jgi:hypothetical protein
MAQTFKEVAHLRGNDELYKNNFDSIDWSLGSKEKKFATIEEELGNSEKIIDGYANIQKELLQKQKRLEAALEVAKEALEWIGKTDTASIVHGPDILWLTSWRNTRKQAAIDTLTKIEQIMTKNEQNQDESKTVMPVEYASERAREYLEKNN